MLRSTKACTVAAPACAPRAFRSLAVQVFDGFWVPLWRPFWITFWYLMSFEAIENMLGLQARFFMMFEWKTCWFLMSQPIKSIANMNVFIRFHFFDFFMNFMILGICLDLILITFGGLGAPLGASGAQSASKTVGVFHGPPFLDGFGTQWESRRLQKMN